MTKSKPVLIIFFIIFSFQVYAQALAEDVSEPAEQKWRTIESQYCTILSHPQVNLKKVNNKVKIRFYDIDRWRHSLKSRDIEEQLAEKLDRIFVKAEKILDMYPRKIHLTVKIYPNQAWLDDAYFQLFGRANVKESISFYVHKYTTIYTTEQAVSQGVIAHEMGHAVCDHYFLILPPEKIKELLAQYVEDHLED